MPAQQHGSKASTVSAFSRQSFSVKWAQARSGCVHKLCRSQRSSIRRLPAHSTGGSLKLGLCFKLCSQLLLTFRSTQATPHRPHKGQVCWQQVCEPIWCWGGSGANIGPARIGGGITGQSISVSDQLWKWQKHMPPCRCACWQPATNAARPARLTVPLTV